jgi:hypothetical protein
MVCMPEMQQGQSNADVWALKDADDLRGNKGYG